MSVGRLAVITYEWDAAPRRARMSLHVVNDCRIPPRFCDCPHLGGGGGNWNTVNPICHPIRRADEASPILRLSLRKTSSADLTASQACPSQNKRDGRHRLTDAPSSRIIAHSTVCRSSAFYPEISLPDTSQPFAFQGGTI